MKQLNHISPTGQFDNGMCWNNANKGFVRNHSTDSNPILLMDPISRLPNIVDSFVEIQDYNTELGVHGIRKRRPTISNLAVSSNKEMNDYLQYVSFRLNVLAFHGKHEEYWAFALNVARRSAVFKTIMLHELKPHWHREMNMKELYILINKYNVMIETLPRDLKYRRVYIPKTFDPETGLVTKHRPLGVPTVAWRLYLHVWHYFLMIFLHKSIDRKSVV